jgi:rubrerythrin
MRSNVVDHVVARTPHCSLLLALGCTDQGMDQPSGGIMSIDPNLTLLEIMGIAIKSKIEAAQVYGRLVQGVRTPTLKEKLLFLKGEEENHRAILEEMYAEYFPEVELLLPPRSLLPRMDVALGDDVPIPELLEMAMERQKLSEKFYADFAKRAEDVRGRAMLQYLSNMESSHYHLLKTERDFISRFPEYYNAEGVHFGENMFHLGP